MESFVALDIETTGLDPNRDSIIEIAAVKFSGSRVEDEWSSLINPNRHIPEFITTLTGIDDAMVRGAPRIRDMAPEFEAFVGNCPVIAHNVNFDLGFLRKYIPFALNDAIDTYELAAVLMPGASRYNLGALCRELAIPIRQDERHRALGDAKGHMAIFLRLSEMARQLPVNLVAEIVRLGESLDWDANFVFQQVLRERLKEGIHAKPGRKDKGVWFDQTKYPPLENPEEAVEVDCEEAAALLEYGGPFASYFETYEHRPEQVEMVRAVTTALSRGNHLMVEAGTGVGKSFAYLIPAALFAVRNNTRVVISTNTINLQDQLISKDIPDLRAALNLDVRAAVLKGRANYLCPRRTENMKHFGPRNADEMRVLAKVLVWQTTDQSGDRNSINLNGNAEREVWLRLSAEDDACTTETCLKRTGGACPFHRARMAAQYAHLLVVNHALLLSDVATGNKVLPEYSRLIIDEGHHVESATTNALSFRLTQYELERYLKDLGGPSAGILGRVLTEGQGILRPSEIGLLQQRVDRATDMSFRLEQLNREFFNTLGAFASLQRTDQTQRSYSWQMRILPNTRSTPGWDQVEITWQAADGTFEALLQGIADIHKAMSELYADGHENLEDLISEVSNAYRRLAEAHANVSGLIANPNAEQVYWIEVNPAGNRLSLNAAPLRVGQLIEKYLWHEKTSVIVTSATLTAHGEFQYLRSTLGADEADELQLGSPFDYESSTLLYVANDIPEPNVNGYQQALDRAIVSTAKAIGGRMLVLFTSYAQLKKTSQAISATLSNDDIFVYEQGDGSSPNALLDAFKSTERAVLLGTRSFWEGVDVPGSSLSAVLITKLPFDVPTDPLIAARSELYEDSFHEYYLPEAILKFRQGFGRLIRTASDRGVVAILDRRVLSKPYGRLFLESLPACTSRQGPTAGLAKAASTWLGS